MTDVPITPLRIVIADDHALFRQGLRSLLRLQDDLTVVAEVDRLAGLDALLERNGCDLLLLDLQMERSALHDLPTLCRRVAVVIVTASERLEDAMEAIRAGARAVVFKRFAIETLMDALQAVRAGDVWMPPTLQKAMASQLHVQPWQQLTAREREIVRHVAMGKRNAEVARALSISEVTVKTHLNNVFQKLDIRDRVELTRYAIRLGLVGVHDAEG
jgi:two-component system, NarL family, response regulator